MVGSVPVGFKPIAPSRSSARPPLSRASHGYPVSSQSLTRLRNIAESESVQISEGVAHSSGLREKAKDVECAHAGLGDVAGA